MTALSMPSPVGQLRIEADDDLITGVQWTEQPGNDRTPLLVRARMQLDAYFAGELTQFELPLRPRGTAFQQRVYRAMCAIEFGRTRTYGDVAADVEGSAQAVGQACGSNPILIIIPCHRVLAAGGLGGFSGAGGVETKVELLRHEGAYGLLF